MKSSFSPKAKPEPDFSDSWMIAEMPERERPRERLLRLGPDALSTVEVLAILLRTGRAGRSVLEVARNLLAAFDGDLRRIAAATIDELRQVPGIGPAKAIELNAAFSLARRFSSLERDKNSRLESPRQVADYMLETLRGKTQEEFHVLLLDTRNGVLRDECVTVGLLDRSQIHAREVFRRAIREACSRVVLVHNHPSGDPSPSPQDIDSTKKLTEAGRIIGIEVLDHVIITESAAGNPPYFSLKENKMM